MKTLSAVAMLSPLLLCGCETGYLRQMDVTDRPGIAISTTTNVDETLVVALRIYASEQGLTCDRTSTLPIRCARPPVQIFAFRTPDGAIVCYGALGMPLENSKHEASTQQLERALVTSFGKDNVTSGQLTHSWSERCKHGA